ncbi:MAG: cell envelope integrity EipB family protein [Rhizobiales bacterium]|mgnify:CR=1 FL=1|nr:cell envelope integrity EipB family protein [Hyphomicrobiales bacterium]
MKTCLLLAGTIAALGGAPALAKTPLVLAPHRAVYDLSFVRSAEARGVDAARGRIVFEISGSACEGYSSSFRQVVQMESGEAGPRMMDVRSSSFEDPEGKGFRFQIDRVNNRDPQQTTAGRTQSGENGLAIQLTKPKADRVPLPRDVLFPSFHTRALIEAAEAGKNTLSARTYDGSDEGKAVYDTFAVIGQPIQGSAGSIEQAARQPALEKMKRWPVTISYYKPGVGDQTPTYVMSMELYENGVSRNLTLDYGSMALKGELSRLDFSKPAADCK